MFVKFRQNFIKISKKNTNVHAFFMKFWMNKLFKLFKNDKIVTTFLLKFWNLSGAKVWKSCRSRKSWKNEYLVAIVAVDTAENGPPKVWPNWINYSVVSLQAMQLDVAVRPLFLTDVLSNCCISQLIKRTAGCNEKLSSILAQVTAISVLHSTTWRLWTFATTARSECV